MTSLGPYEVHPFADAFPMMEGAEFDDFVLDIKRNGMREAITLSHDLSVLIDGRNRYRACEAAGRDPVFETLPERYTELMILDLIVSRNVQRRQLNPGQRAMLALEYERFYTEAAAEAQRAAGTLGNQTRHGLESPVVADRPQPAITSGNQTRHSPSADRKEREASATTRAPVARERAAKAVGASGRLVGRAKTVRRDAPDLAEKVRGGWLALDNAYKQARERTRNLPRPEAVAKPGPVLLTLRTHDGAEVPYPKPKTHATFNETAGDGISWAQWSWNPVTGCLHGCEYCYAREIATNERYRAAYPVGFTPLFHHERLSAPANTTVPVAHRDDPAWRRVFVCSMADLYGRWVPDEWIEQVHAAMLASPQWAYLLLTKFPSRYVGLRMPSEAWVGTSVDEQKRVRIAENAFREVSGVRMKWLSLEPLREPLVFTDLSMFDWVVIGAQTESRQPNGFVPAFAPPFEWVSRIVAQAREAGCKVHMKPNLGGRPNGNHPGMQLIDEYPEDGTAQ